MSVNLRWGFGWSFPFAAFFSVIALFIALRNGSLTFKQNGLTLWGVVGAYFLAATLAGFVLALLRPLTSYRFGAFILGAVIGFFAYGSIGVVMFGFKSIVPLVSGILAFFTGLLGIVFYDER
jgi:hypothetical protein